MQALGGGKSANRCGSDVGGLPVSRHNNSTFQTIIAKGSNGGSVDARAQVWESAQTLTATTMLSILQNILLYIVYVIGPNVIWPML